ncbi:MAG: hypothetical protein V4472_11660 [Pseudomonadota bacterium]
MPEFLGAAHRCGGAGLVGATSVDRGAAAGMGADSTGLSETVAITAMASRRPVQAGANIGDDLALVLVHPVRGTIEGATDR